MAVPRNRHSNARKNQRRSHHARRPKHLLKCPNCQQPTLPHHLCSACRCYQGRSYVQPEKRSAPRG